LDRNEKFYITPNAKYPWVKLPADIYQALGQPPWTWESIVTIMLDLQSIPTRYFFEVLSRLAENELEKEKLFEFSKPEGQEDRYNYCNRPRRNVLEVLHDFSGVIATMCPRYTDMIFDLIPPIKPRSFSIASSRLSSTTTIEILVAVVKYNTKLKAPRYGLCSNWLASLKPGDPMLVSVSKGSFTFPSEHEVSKHSFSYSTYADQLQRIFNLILLFELELQHNYGWTWDGLCPFSLAVDRSILL